MIGSTRLETELEEYEKMASARNTIIAIYVCLIYTMFDGWYLTLLGSWANFYTHKNALVGGSIEKWRKDQGG